MKLQGKNLAIQMHGADVKLLQTELRQLGYTISQDESARSFFASTTQQAVSAFQRSNRLPVTGIVNERTARLINTKIDALQPQRFTVHGTVTRSDGAPLAGATVRAVDWDRAGEDSLGEATIQSDGRYEISYTADQFRRSPSEVGGPDLIVRVYDAQGLLLANSPRKNNAQADETIDLTVPVLEQKPFADSFVVRGQILKADGSPLTGGIVRAFDKDLRHEQPLGEQTTTDEEGRYEITYTRAQFRRTGKKRADLIVRVFDGEELLLAASQVIFNARPVEVVDLEISWDEKSVLSEYEHIMKEIAPLLADQQIADLKEDSEDKPEAGKFQDISFLSGETGINTQHLSFLVIAAKLSRQTQTAPEIFYGLFRQNIPTALSSLLAQDIQTHRIALKTSLSDCIIPSHFQDELEKNLQTLHSLPEGEIFKKPTFLVKPDVLFNNLTDLSRLDRKEADFIGIKLNEYFCSELLNAIGTVSEPMKTSLKSAFARIGYQTFKDSELFEVMLENILPEIKKDRTLTQEVSEIEKRLANRPSQKISELLHLNVPSRDNPILHFEFRKAKTLTYANLVKLSDEVVQQLMEKNLYLDDADETMLADLVREKIISSQQKADLKLTIDLGRLTGDNIPFIKAIKTPEITSIANIVSWEKADWQRLMTAANIPLPPGETSETYTENILLNIEKTYPSQVLFSTLLNARQIARVKKLDSLNPLLSSHDKLIDGKSPARIDWGNIAAEGSESLQQDLQDLTAFANTYRHLDIAELINDKNFDLAQKKEAINGRLQLLDTFYNNNPMLDLRLVNLVDNNAARLLNWQNISEADQPRLRKQLMAYQRILNLAEETSDRQVLLSKGYDSAVAIARQTEAQFSKTSDLPSGKNRLIYAKAQEVSLSLAHSHEMIRDTIRGSFKHLAMAYNLNPTLFNDLRDVAGFEELFEPQDFCACEECKSILSPAAYFVDLMHFIEQYISNPVFSSRFDHPLYLKRRRGDLWKLNLTCENTYTLVPQLIIVNEILETYLEGVVHGDIFERLSRGSEKMSFTLPFNLPLEELRIYLNHFGISTHMLYKTLLQPYQKIWRARLNLSEEEYTVIITPDFAGVKFRFGDHGSFTKFDVQDFIRYAGITRQQLDDLLALTFNPDLHNIKVSKDIQPYELQNFPEVLLYLTRNRLDFIHRFIRLWRKTEWTIPELDLILSALKDAKLIRQRGKFSNNKGLNKDAVLYVAQLIDLQESLKLTVEELCGMVHQLPVSDAFPLSPVKQSDKKLFERLFDVQTLFKHEEDCLFGWEEVTGNDSIKFIELLGQIFDIEWDNTSKIEKIENGKAIRVSTPKNNLSLRLNDKKTKVSLEIDDGRSDEFISKMKNGKLNIYHETSFSFHHYSLNKNNSDDHEIDSNTPILLGGWAFLRPNCCCFSIS